MKKRVFSLFLALCLIVTALGIAPAAAAGGDGVLRIGTSMLSGSFSPFFFETVYDQNVWAMTAVNLLETDRHGAVVEKGKTGETRPCGGADYTYSGIADLTVTENADGTIAYDFDLRDDVFFSDGVKLTADDVIFSMYVLSDPTYDGSSSFSALPIVGMGAYRAGMAPLYRLMIDAGEDNTDFSLWSEQEQTTFWSRLHTAGPAFAQSICDFCIANGYNQPGDSVAQCAENWGYDLPADATAADFWETIFEAYGYDLLTAVRTEAADVSWESLFPDFAAYTKGVSTGSSADCISGIEKTGDYSLRVTLTNADAPAIYQLAVSVAPMHYYGDASLYDYDNHQFGFPKGDLSGVKAKTGAPMGAGPYKFVSYENGVVSFEANDSYFKGAPRIRQVQLVEYNDSRKLFALFSGDIDITDSILTRDSVNAITETNGNGSLTGPVITTSSVDNLGYGYLGISAEAVNVGGSPGSDASKSLRKAFATVFSIFRDVTVNSYYGPGVASVINYPISNTSWAAPQPSDADYTAAFSRDAQGNGIYTAGMDDAAREEACLNAALGFFEAAGYTVAGGQVTAAPAGAAMSYEVWIPADGAGDHPSFMMLNLAKDALARIGIELVIRDLTNSSDLWVGLGGGQVPMWCAAWGAAPDPDMYQIYYSGSQGGDAGGSNYMYDIADAELDRLVLEARQSTDQAYRKQLYRQCLDIIMDWAVEVPVYQRQNAILFSSERIDTDSIAQNLTTYYDWVNEIQNLRLRGGADCVITAQPQDFTGAVGETAVFTVEATGDGLTYQWQYREPGSSVWKNSSFTTPTMTCKITAARDGRQYRCVITDAYGNELTSEPATIIVRAALAIKQQPQDFEGAVGETATFSVKATGDGLTYQWQYREPGSSTWLNSSFKTPSMTCKITAARDGRQYRCIVTDASNHSVTSDAAAIKVKASLAITQQPQDFTGAAGETATFTVKATGEGLTYQWQYKDPGKDWANSSFKAASMSCKLTAARNGRQYRCIVQDAYENRLISDAATITVKQAITITQQPQNFVGAVGETATFAVGATGEGLTYQWQYREPGGSTWLNSSFKTPSMTCKITAARDGREYRCIVTDASGRSVTSEAAMIIVGTKLAITSQPQDFSGKVGATAKFSVAAAGDDLTYQWQYKDVGGDWANSSFKTATMTCKITAARDGRQYRCIVRDSHGVELISDAATIHVTA